MSDLPPVPEKQLAVALTEFYVGQIDDLKERLYRAERENADLLAKVRELDRRIQESTKL